jgi:hypothetical protein
MTTPTRAANLASLIAVVALSAAAVATTSDGDTEEAAGSRTATATAGDPSGVGGIPSLATDEPVVAGSVMTAGPSGTGQTDSDTDGPVGGVGVGGPVGGDTGSEGEHIAGDLGTADSPEDGGTGNGSSVVLVDDPEAGRRGLEALATIEFPWQDRLEGWQIRFRAASTGAYGYTLPDEQRIEIYVRADQSDELLAHVVAHELGHAVDVTYNTADDRQAWREARGLGDAPWWPDDRAADFATGAGDWAECFASAMLGPGSFRSELGDPPTPDQIELMAELSGGFAGA